MTSKYNRINKNKDFIKMVLSSGRYTFTTVDFIKWSKKSKIASRAFLRRSIKNGIIASPCRGFYVVIPPEYTSIGCLPPEQFIDPLMQYLDQRYYVGLLSNLSLYGWSHQQPQMFQVITNKKRPNITCGKIKISFIKSNRIAKTPLNNFKTPRGFIKTSTLEATIIDLFLYSKQSGGFNNIATILSELSKQITAANINDIIKLLPNIAIAQRLGYIFDRILRKQKLSKPLKFFVDKKAKSFIPLLRSGNRSNIKRDEKWKLFINTTIEADI